MPLSRTGIYLHQICASTNAVLQFNHDAGRGLMAWKWPVNTDGERIPPSALSEHRLSHRFLGPCCLCPVITPAPRGGWPEFIEAAILMATGGRLSGQYIAACARGRCGYIVHIEHIYSRSGVPVQAYPRRDPSDPPPPPVTVQDQAISTNADPGGNTANRPRPLGRTYALSNITNRSVRSVHIPPPRAPTRTRRRDPSALDLLLQLDSAVRPGLSRSHFRSLFARCACGLITTRAAFSAHYCLNENSFGTDVIEITDSDSSV